MAPNFERASRATIAIEANKPRGRALRRHGRQIPGATNNRRAVHPVLHQGNLARWG